MHQPGLGFYEQTGAWRWAGPCIPVGLYKSAMNICSPFIPVLLLARPVLDCRAGAICGREDDAGCREGAFGLCGGAPRRLTIRIHPVAGGWFFNPLPVASLSVCDRLSNRGVATARATGLVQQLCRCCCKTGGRCVAVHRRVRYVPRLGPRFYMNHKMAATWRIGLAALISRDPIIIQCCTAPSVHSSLPWSMCCPASPVVTHICRAPSGRAAAPADGQVTGAGVRLGHHSGDGRSNHRGHRTQRDGLAVDSAAGAVRCVLCRALWAEAHVNSRSQRASSRHSPPPPEMVASKFQTAKATARPPMTATPMCELIPASGFSLRQGPPISTIKGNKGSFPYS